MSFALVSGQFLFSNGLPIVGGILNLQLVGGPATIIATGGGAPSSYSFTLDSNGAIPAGSFVYGNAELSPAGTYYTVTVTSGGVTVWGPMNWAVGPASLYSGSLYPNVVVLPSFAGISGVSSVFGRTGAVVATSGDYNEGQVTPVLVTVTFSATPTFNCATGSSFKMTLTGNVTSSSLSGAQAGQRLYFEIIQDATGNRSFAWPANFIGVPDVNRAPNGVTVASFLYDGTNAYAIESPSNELAAALSSSNFALAGWGAAASVSAVRGSDFVHAFTVTADPTYVPPSPFVLPTITLTFVDGAHDEAPIVLAQMTGGTGEYADLAISESTTGYVLTYNGVPMPGATYIFRAHMQPSIS